MQCEQSHEGQWEYVARREGGGREGGREGGEGGREGREGREGGREGGEGGREGREGREGGKMQLSSSAFICTHMYRKT